MKRSRIKNRSWLRGNQMLTAQSEPLHYRFKSRLIIAYTNVLQVRIPRRNLTPHSQKNREEATLYYVYQPGAQLRPLAAQKQQQVLPRTQRLIPTIDSRQRRYHQFDHIFRRGLECADEHHGATRVQQEVRRRGRWRVRQDLLVD